MTHVKCVSCFKIRYTCYVPTLCCDAIKAIQKKKKQIFIITIIRRAHQYCSSATNCNYFVPVGQQLYARTCWPGRFQSA